MDTATRKKRRESNIELLRLVCMGMIVLFHCTSAIKRNECTEGERIILTAIGSWGILGVDTFIIITAWFMRKATEVKLHKTVGMIAMTLFYIAVFYAISYFTGHKSLASWAEGLGNDFLFSPFFTTSYWFIWSYLALYAIIPYLNRISLQGPVCYVLAAFLLLANFQSHGTFIEDFPFFIAIYLTCRIVLSRPGNFFERHAAAGFTVCTLLIIASSCWLKEVPYTRFLQVFFCNIGRHSSLMLADSLFLFYLFRNWKMNCHKTVNFLAGTAFGIYLFHENKAFRLSHLVTRQLHTQLPPLESVLLSSLILFAGGMVAELLRMGFVRLARKVLRARAQKKEPESSLHTPSGG